MGGALSDEVWLSFLALRVIARSALVRLWCDCDDGISVFAAIASSADDEPCADDSGVLPSWSAPPGTAIPLDSAFCASRMR